MKKSVGASLLVLLGLVGVIICVGIGYNLGFDAGAGSIECTQGKILSMEVSKSDGLGNGLQVLSIGDCRRIDEAAFIAAMEAFSVGQVATTTTTRTTTTSPTTASASTTLPANAGTPPAGP